MEGNQTQYDRLGQILNIQHTTVPGNTLECFTFGPSMKDYWLPAMWYAF